MNPRRRVREKAGQHELQRGCINRRVVDLVSGVREARLDVVVEPNCEAFERPLARAAVAHRDVTQA